MAPTSELPLIGSTFTARITEDIYQHLRERMEKDEKIHAYVKKLMEESPSRVLQMRPTFNKGSQTNLPFPNIVVHNPGTPKHPGPQASLVNHIKVAYENYKHLESEEYVKHINARLELQRRPSGHPKQEYFGDTELRRVEGWLQDYVRVAEKHLKLKLANRTKVMSSPTFGPRLGHVLVFILFWIWVALGIVLFYFSALDDQCSLIVEKHTDYNVTIDPSHTLHWCFLGVSEQETNAIQSLDYVTVIAYLESRRWRSSVFLNLSILALGALLAKIVTNFVSGEPGLAGLRLNGTIKIGPFKHTFRHKDLELTCEPRYHIQRYMEEHRIYVPDFKDKYAIDRIYETCVYKKGS